MLLGVWMYREFVKLPELRNAGAIWVLLGDVI